MDLKVITDTIKIKLFTKKNVNIIYIKYNKKRAFYSTDLRTWRLASVDRVKSL